jgi:SAM-dependent methyltransferase
MKVALVHHLRCVDCMCNEIFMTNKEGDSSEVLQGSLECGQCHRIFPIAHGIANLLPTHVLRKAETGNSQKLAEIQYYNDHISPKPDEEQNLNYGLGWSLKRATKHTDMYNYYLNRICRNISLPLNGKLLLDVGCGAGQEAEFFAKKSRAQVVGLDIALGTVDAATRRSFCFGYRSLFDGIVGDMECMPFRDKSIDICLTHTSLHHATNPFKALSEMARVAKDGIIIASESVRSLSIRIALLLGLTSEYEKDESGNRVWRPCKRELWEDLRKLGARQIKMSQNWHNTNGRIRWGKIAGRSVRPVTSFLESEFMLRLQDRILGPIGNLIFVMAEF